ncbi:hypothetical protein QM012_008662 [Aureobasidium pullulans]|uniref:Uncharacterized protein n=1 Tax=Aureobasidium pullulans TaxID=5580 RepID=A0ABR0TK15_AURPU
MDPRDNEICCHEPRDPGRAWSFWQLDRLQDIALGVDWHARRHEPEPPRDLVPGRDEYDIDDSEQQKEEEMSAHDGNADSSTSSSSFADQYGVTSSPALNMSIHKRVDADVRNRNRLPSSTQNLATDKNSNHAVEGTRSRDNNEEENDSRIRRTRSAPVRAKREG